MQRKERGSRQHKRVVGPSVHMFESSKLRINLVEETHCTTRKKVEKVLPSRVSK